MRPSARRMAPEGQARAHRPHAEQSSACSTAVRFPWTGTLSIGLPLSKAVLSPPPRSASSTREWGICRERTATNRRRPDGSPTPATAISRIPFATIVHLPVAFHASMPTCRGNIDVNYILMIQRRPVGPRTDSLVAPVQFDAFAPGGQAVQSAGQRLEFGAQRPDLRFDRGNLAGCARNRDPRKRLHPATPTESAAATTSLASATPESTSTSAPPAIPDTLEPRDIRSRAEPDSSARPGSFSTRPRTIPSWHDIHLRVFRRILADSWARRGSNRIARDAARNRMYITSY